MLRELVELWRATVNLGLAKLNARRAECPPHEFDPRYEFCLRCGEYPPLDERSR